MVGEEELRAIAADLRRGATRLAHRLRTERSTGALSLNKLTVLGHLHRHGPSTPGEVAAAEHQRPQSLTRVFAALQADGLVSRGQSDRDGRESVLDLTPAGHEALRRDMADRDAWLAAALAELTDAEAHLVRIAASLLDHLADAAPDLSRGEPAMTASTEPDWITHAIWWQVYPLGFLGADTTGADRAPTVGLRQLVDWLDYARDLGTSGILLGPIFASGSHGYDTVDHHTIDPRLGTLDDFTAFVDAAHERGLKILLDGVFNHVGRDFPTLRRAMAGGPGTPEARWFRLS